VGIKKVSALSELNHLQAELNKLQQTIATAMKPIMLEIPSHELKSNGWEVMTATTTELLSNGRAPPDDFLWRGTNPQSTVNANLFCGRVLLSGMLVSVGTALTIISQRDIAGTEYVEVSYGLFRLPIGYRPNKTHSFGRRPHDPVSGNPCASAGLHVRSSLPYEPLRRLDMLTSGHLCLVVCIEKSMLSSLSGKPKNWYVCVDEVKYFLEE